VKKAGINAENKDQKLPTNEHESGTKKWFGHGVPCPYKDNMTIEPEGPIYGNHSSIIDTGSAKLDQN